MHTGMALVGAVGPYQHAVYVGIGGGLQLVSFGSNVLDFQRIKHERLITII